VFLCVCVVLEEETMTLRGHCVSAPFGRGHMWVQPLSHHLNDYALISETWVCI
jgi:hypothetical protein